ncbi:MAG: hypothetical protein NTU57_02635 [Candidatus Aenigmarchaeota archaeon]|nr:hypothetical protein [Candidatus Aenigmarchaeota archaeon]
MNGKKVLLALQIGGAIFTVASIVFALTVYSFGTFLNNNFVYMAVFYDAMAADFHAGNQSSDVVTLASITASKYCAMYSAERRTLDYDKYGHLCSAIGNRTVFFMACYNGMRTDCSDDAIPGVDDPLALELYNSAPYMSFIFNNDIFKFSEKQRQGFLAG